MKSRYVAAGALVGILAGIILGLLFPILLQEVFEIYTRLLYRSELSAVPTTSPTYMTIFNVLPIVCLITGLIGAIVGWIVFKLKSLN